MARGHGIDEAAVEDARAMAVTAPSRLSAAPRFRLNSQDRFLLLENEMLQERGAPGPQCQAHVWGDGRVDEAALRRAVARLAVAHPAATARLVRTPLIGDVYWQARPGAEIPVEVVHAEDDSEDAVLRIAEKILYRKIDLANDPPMWFVLVRRPTAGDVLVIPYSHVLMDGKAPEEMLLALDREEEPAPDGDARRNEVAAWLSSYPLWRRVYAMNRLMVNTVFGRARPDKVLTVPQSPGPWKVGDGIRFHLRTLDPDATERIRRRVRQTIGMESFAPALVASAFRAIAALHPPDMEGVCRTYVPVTLRAARGFDVPIFCNLSSDLPLAVRRPALANRDALVRELHARIRAQIREGRDMAVAQAGLWLTEKRRPVAWRFVWRSQTWDMSFIFGYHGTAAPELQRILGVPVTRLYNAVSIANPPGISLSVYQAAGSLHFAVTRVDGAVPGDLTDAFLDRFLEDLVG